MTPEQKQLIAKKTADAIYEAYPNLWDRFGDRGYAHTIKDNHHHLDYLETAWELNSSQSFVDYVIWLETVLVSRNVETALIIDNFKRLIEIVPRYTETMQGDFMLGCLDRAVRLLELPQHKRS